MVTCVSLPEKYETGWKTQGPKLKFVPPLRRVVLWYRLNYPLCAPVYIRRLWYTYCSYLVCGRDLTGAVVHLGGSVFSLLAYVIITRGYR